MSQESEQSSQHPDIPPQFPALQKNDGNFTYHLTLDKSVNKAFTKLVSVIIINSIAIGAASILAIWMIFEWRALATEARVQTQEIIYTQAAVIAHGIPLPHPPGNKPAEKP
jgi:hypothetical protein